MTQGPVGIVRYILDVKRHVMYKVLLMVFASASSGPSGTPVGAPEEAEASLGCSSKTFGDNRLLPLQFYYFYNNTLFSERLRSLIFFQRRIQLTCMGDLSISSVVSAPPLRTVLSY